MGLAKGHGAGGHASMGKGAQRRPPEDTERSLKAQRPALARGGARIRTGGFKAL